MWSKLFLCFLVGIAYARLETPAWKENTEYTYEVRGRSLASLHEISDDYTGILLRAKLVVQPQSDDKLRCKILQPEYAEVQTKLPEGWRSEFPETQLTWQTLEMTNKPFDVVMKNGIVRELIVEQEVSEWEANIIKSFVSQLQLDTKAENRIDSHLNVLPKEGSNNAVFKTLEDTVTGITETTYDIHPLPEYILQSEPHLAPFPHLKGDGSIIEIVKSKNYTAGHDLPSYYFGLGRTGQWKPEANQLGQIWQRNSLGRAIITGTLQRYTIQFSETVNEIIISPLKGNQQKGSVKSMMRIKLINADQLTNKLPELKSQLSLGSLVYSYEKQPSSNKVTAGKTFNREQYQTGSWENSEEERSNYLHKRHPRSLRRDQESYEGSIESEEEWTVPKSKLNEAPRSPLLPYTTGYKGFSIKRSENVKIVEKVTEIAQQIGQEIENEQEIPKKQTLAKFVILTSALRIMDEQELKQVAQRLYTQETQGPKAETWKVFRDSVAETGTGPALLLIKELIETNKIQGGEAQRVVLTMTEAVRQPTGEYMKTVYDMVRKQMTNQHDQSMLNETMLLSFSNLVRIVYVDGHYSHKEYPTHSFGKFNTEEGKTFVREEFIPYLTKQLREAIDNGDARKIQVYIRALGLVGDKKIVYTFEPYLEGKTPCSQFQRFLMVLALKHVTQNQPSVARPLLYRIYQNVGETTEIRVAAVFMMMHTNPSVEMLQRMAMYTNMEPNHRVSAAVKSAIESASELKGVHFAELRSSAQAARSFLTKKQNGIADSLDVLESFASEHWESYYKHVMQSIVGEETGMPSSFYYAIEGKENGYFYRTFGAEAVISDIRNVFHVFHHQTEWYQQQRDQQQQAQQNEKSQWASHKIAHLLNLKTEELEQLEGGFFFNIGEWSRHIIFDNHTFERLPEMVQHIENVLENGKQLRFTKIINNEDYAIAFPTEMGLPFLYTYDEPILMKLEGNLKGKAQPKMSSGKKLSMVENVEIEGDFKITLSRKKHSEFGFICPFNHQHYSAGYDRNAQIHTPFRANIKIDLKEKKVRLQVESLESEKDVNLFHKSSWPYISKHDILSLQATAERKGTHIIQRRLQNNWEHVVGDKTMGMAFRVKYENDGKYTALDQLIKPKIFRSEIQYEQVNFEYVPSMTQNKKINMEFSFDVKDQTEYQQEQPRNVLLNKLSQLPRETKQRVPEMARQVSAGIEQARVYVVDSMVQFLGKQNVEFTSCLAYARSEVNAKSRVSAQIKKTTQLPESKPFEVVVSGKLDLKKISGLDMDYVMNADLTSSAEIDVAYGQQSTENKVQIDTQFRRSEERKQYLQEQPMYHKCQREMQQGNKQLLACANMTQMAGLLDQIKIQIQSPVLKTEQLVKYLNFYNAWFNGPDFRFEENRESRQQQGEITVKVGFQPDLKRVNVSVANQGIYAQIKNMHVNEWAKRVFVLHPAFDIVDRLQGKLYGLMTYKPICTMDKNEAYSFDGAEYSLALNNFWTVLLQYVPLRSQGHSEASVEEQLKHELENYVILARQSSQGADAKDVKIIVSTPRTEGKVMEITMKPRSNTKYPQVFVDEKPVTVVEQGKYMNYQNQVLVSALENGEVYVKVHDAFYVIYDGTRVKITATSQKLRNRIRGTCGNFNGCKSDDFLTPSNCVVREPREFIASYTVLKDGEQNQEIMDLKTRGQKNHCIHKKVPLFVDYITKKSEHEQHHSSGSCSKYQTRYVMENGQICFTIKPLTVCKNGCEQRGSVFKNIEVHCVENKNVAALWKSQIDKGASPDFSSKPVTKTIQMDVPQSCKSL